MENYSSDLSSFRFVVLPGRLEVVETPQDKQAIRQMFVELIKGKICPRIFYLL